FGMVVKAVAKGRGGKANAVRAGFGEGRIVVAEEAKRLGMIDRVETLDAVLARLTGRRFSTRTTASVRTLVPAAGNQMCGMRAGENLGRLLDEAIEREVTEERTRSDVIKDMADEAGLSPSTVNPDADVSIEFHLERVHVQHHIANIIQEAGWGRGIIAASIPTENFI
ncbi:MAG: hypothetical protein IIA60_09980, partial [Candidatus Marinimicrobia bacterium]|nr:hypothetical protein [Candidatus Neomarinimicrobiota bacterium]